MDATYRFAWKEDDTALYLDASDCMYAAKNGNLAWRINNPGLVKHHCRFAKKNGSIGAWEKFAIFSNPLQGHQALKEWLHSKTMLQLDLYGIGKYYRNEFEKISNVTVLDSGSMWEHSFNNESYQNIVREKIEKYRKSSTKITLMDSQKLLIESFV